MAENGANVYVSTVEVDLPGHEPTQAHLSEATDKFMTEAKDANPGMAVGTPQLVGTSFVVGQHVTYRFSAELSANASEAPNGDSQRNRPAKPNGNQQPA